ncbi:hypothetical protein GM3709_3300 [Geminocystis sp. NIES-3709]|nr:hypothetical protein GM3709_3300 [Geminocystis sp. NIES-3709]
MISATGKSVMAQATATGAIVEFNPVTGYTQSVSGEITLPTGAFNGPLNITPVVSGSASPLDPIIPFLIINPGGIDFSIPPTTLNAQAAEILLNAFDLSDIVSILRANTNFLSNGTANQAIATGQTTLLYPDGSTQSVSGEISLPTGLYYEGASSPQDGGGNDIDPTCGIGSGCLVIGTVFDEAQDVLANPTGVPRIKELIIDPGVPNIAGSGYDFNAAAAFKLTAIPLADLSDIVSVIRAGSGINGPFSTQLQARAMGMVMVGTPDGTTLSVSGEITLPAGLYFDGTLFDIPGGGVANVDNDYCPGSSCLAVLPDIRWRDSLDSNSAFINQLTINPGFVSPGDPANLTGLFSPSSFDFNAAVAGKLYEYIEQDQLTQDQLANIVSVIRAGAGSRGLSPENRPIARASGSATIVLPNGSTQSVSAELSLPTSLYFLGADPANIQDTDASTGCTNGTACFLLTPSFEPIDPLNPNLVTISQLSIDPGSPNDPSTIRGWDFDAAAADALTKATTLEAQVSIIRAGAGSGLE